MERSWIKDDDVLKSRLEVLRGRPLEDLELELDRWKERSDPLLLCKNPLVSVHMVTYNHEPFIRQALDSVLMQQCDFPFEVVIGEDCSTDRTREICFEYQVKYPDKIRVLYAEENSFRRHRSQCINVWRVTKSCRGEFAAWCEGDDYWVDPKKLQKEVDIFRQHPKVGFVFSGAIIDNSQEKRFMSVEGLIQKTPSGIISGKNFFEWTMYRKSFCMFTPTMMWRHRIYRERLNELQLKHWAMLTADIPLELIMGSWGDTYFLPDVLAAYRVNPLSVSHTIGDQTHLDTLTAVAYFGALFYGIPPEKHRLAKRFFRTRLQEAFDCGRGIMGMLKVFLSRGGRKYFVNPLNLLYIPALYGGGQEVAGILVREGIVAFAFERIRRLMCMLFCAIIMF